ncbi:hypothetical protein [Streptomyces sp. F001]|uniref:hypothetical protein n=1 Tax=Streptomyces sp. F001 TaxID=1510026 RepID=UPI0019D0E4DB|nr:hypothetical protein [Streptomyces sp. F001]
MRGFLEAATGFPALLFTAALVVVGCFWLLVAVGAAEPDSFDRDADLDAWGMGGAPVAVAFSLLTVFAWLLGLGAAILLDAFAASGVLGGLLRITAPVWALLVAWRLTCVFVRPLHRLFPDEPGPSRPAETEVLVSGSTALPRACHEAGEPGLASPYDVALELRDRAA